MHEVLTAAAARLHRCTERRGHAGTAVPRRALRLAAVRALLASSGGGACVACEQAWRVRCLRPGLAAVVRAFACEQA